jgi:hypothetical protein
MLEAKFVAMTWLLPQRAMGTGLERDIVEDMFKKRGFVGVLLFLRRLDFECLIN